MKLLTNLRDGEEVLGDINNILHLFNGSDAVGDSLGVLLTGGVKKTFDMLEKSRKR